AGPPPAEAGERRIRPDRADLEPGLAQRAGAGGSPEGRTPPPAAAIPVPAAPRLRRDRRRPSPGLRASWAKARSGRSPPHGPGALSLGPPRGRGTPGRPDSGAAPTARTGGTPDRVAHRKGGTDDLRAAARRAVRRRPGAPAAPAGAAH